jgi:hypothetical protein
MAEQTDAANLAATGNAGTTTGTTTATAQPETVVTKEAATTAQPQTTTWETSSTAQPAASEVTKNVTINDAATSSTTSTLTDSSTDAAVIAAQAKADTAKKDAELTAAREESGSTFTKTDVTSDDAIKSQIEATDKALEERSAANEEGYAKLEQKIVEQAEAAAKASELAPTTGKEWNRNTPRLDKAGNKIWD